MRSKISVIVMGFASIVLSTAAFAELDFNEFGYGQNPGQWRSSRPIFEAYCDRAQPTISDCTRANICQSLGSSQTCNIANGNLRDRLNNIASAAPSGLAPVEGGDNSSSGADPGGHLARDAARQVGHNRNTGTMSEYRDMNQCNIAKRDATRCCDDPISCMTDGKLTKNSKMAIEAIAMMILPQLSGAENVQKICKLQQGMALVSGSINILAINNCEKGRRACANECGNIRQSAEAQLQRLPDVPQNTLDREEWSERVRLAEEAEHDCNGLSDNTAALSMETMSNVNQFITARTCANNSLTANALNVPDVDLNPDCANAANASNPICQTSCSNPANANTAACRQFGNVGTGDGTYTSGDSVAAAAGGANVPDDVMSQETPFGKYDTKNSNAGVAQNGGAMLGSDGSSGGSSMLGGKGGGGSQGKNTDIMQGFRGGGGFGGYSVSSVDTESRGGYSAGGGGPPPDDGFNLKKFLPGFGAKRSIAGLGAPRANPDLGMAHEDIFTKMTRAMARQCIQSALQDCQVSTKPGK